MDFQKKLCDTLDCTGCGACYNICSKKAINMIADEEGFLFPQINKEKCINCGLCTKVCPQINVKEKTMMQHIYAAYAKDDKIRCASSSGGIFSVIANYVIDQKGCVVGASLNEEYKLSHIVVSQKKDLYKIQGSKYFQSEIGDIYFKVKDELKKSRMVLFCGTPCQVAGLLSYLNGMDITKLITCDFICHGVPSSLPIEKIIMHIKGKGIKFSNLYFRDYSRWSIGFHVKKSFLGKNYIQPLSGEENAYFQFYLAGDMNRECCYKCQYSNVNRISDITIADFWNISENSQLISKDKTKGVSCIGVNSLKGENIIDIIKKDIFLQERDLTEIVQKNTQLSESSQRSKNRDSFYMDLSKCSWKGMLEKYNYRYRKLNFKQKTCRFIRVLYSICS